MRVAVTSSNGKTINSHFGKAKTFFVYDIKDKEIIFLEKRSSPGYCSTNPKHAFRAEDFSKVAEVIEDCQALYTKQIGAVPAEKFKSMGIEVSQKEGEILAALGL